MVLFVVGGVVFFLGVFWRHGHGTNARVTVNERFLSRIHFRAIGLFATESACLLCEIDTYTWREQTFWKVEWENRRGEKFFGPILITDGIFSNVDYSIFIVEKVCRKSGIIYEKKVSNFELEVGGRSNRYIKIRKELFPVSIHHFTSNRGIKTITNVGGKNENSSRKIQRISIDFDRSHLSINYSKHISTWTRYYYAR